MAGGVCASMWRRRSPAEIASTCCRLTNGRLGILFEMEKFRGKISRFVGVARIGGEPVLTHLQYACEKLGSYSASSAPGVIEIARGRRCWLPVSGRFLEEQAAALELACRRVIEICVSNRASRLLN